MICAQQESIDVLKQMLIKLFNKKKQLKTKGSSSQEKGIEVDSSTSESSDGEDANFEKPPTLPEEKEGSDVRSDHSKRMSELEKHLEALANRKSLQEAGVVRPYPAEQDLVPYPPKFKALNLQAFDGKARLTNIYTTSNPKQGLQYQTMPS